MSQALAIRDELSPEISPLESDAKAITITDQLSYDEAAAMLKLAVSRRRRITDRMKEGRELAYAAWKEWTRLESEMLAMVTGAEKLLNRKIAFWDQEQERERQAEQRRLDAAAAAREEEERLQAAIEAEEAGESPELVEAIMETVEPPPPAPVAVKAYSPAKGISRPTYSYSAEVTDLMALVRYVVAHQTEVHLVAPNMTGINSRAREQRDMFALPGCKLVKTPRVVVRL